MNTRIKGDFMNSAEIFLEDGTKRIVNCLFYLYNSNYYFLYTENEKDENGYIKLYLSKIGKETVNSENGPVETGNMIGIEVQTDDEWKEVQGSISKIVNSKKTKVDDSSIQYLPIDMLVNLKIVGKKTFRLLSDIIEKDFGISLGTIENEIKNDSNSDLENLDLNRPIEEDASSENTNPFVEQTNENINDAESVENQASQKTLETDEIISELDSSIGSEEQITNEDDKDEIKDSFEITTGETEAEEDYENPDIIIDYRTRFFEEQEKNKKLQDEIEKLNKKLLDIKEIIDKI